jgi:hypothetical protein
VARRDLTGELESVHPWQGEVDDCDVGSQGAHGAEGLVGGRCFAHEREVRCAAQQGSHALPHDLVIVDQ